MRQHATPGRSAPALMSTLGRQTHARLERSSDATPTDHGIQTVTE